MEGEEVLRIYNLLQNSGTEIIIDGGWSVDALLGKKTREHKDLDIALEWKDVPALRKILSRLGYKQVEEYSKWNFVLRDNKNHEIDVHAFIYDKEENVIDGIMYPAESLKGSGVIDGQEVRCISPEYQVEFLAKWIHKWPEKYLDVVSLLCAKFGIDLPEEYMKFKVSS